MTPRDPQLFAFVRDAVTASLSHMQSAITSGKYIPQYFDWPSISIAADHLPYLSRSFLDGPKHYADVIGFGQNAFISPEAIPELEELRKYLGTLDAFKRLASVAGNEVDTMSEFFARRIPLGIAERWCYTDTATLPSEDQILELYLPLETRVFSERLDIDIWVPLTRLLVEVERFDLAENISIERIPDALQVGRMRIVGGYRGGNERLIAKATHAVVLRGWSIENSSYWDMAPLLGNPGVYPLNLIDKIFAAIRIVKHVHTGYAQIAVEPVGWVNEYEADAVPVLGARTRAYPFWFEDSNLGPPDLITASDLEQVAAILKPMLDLENNSVTIAIRRLNSCLLRETEEDSVLDATIAMEALFSDSSPQEMTHKLALRMAGLMKVHPHASRTPDEMFRTVKKVYEFRSAIVHGSKSAEKKRSIEVAPERVVPTVQAAIEALRECLRVVIEHPRFLSPEIIDKELLLGAGVARP